MALYSNPDDTIAALATPGGTGAIGVIRLSGKDAISITNRVFRGKDLLRQSSHTIHFGRIMQGEEELDEVLVSLFIAPRSYTGENVVEISCHGSSFIQQGILELLIKEGARPATPGEFTLRAFLNKRMDLSQAEAVADLIASGSASAHRTAMNQMKGGFSRQIGKLREELVNFASLIELELDFAEEDVEFADREKLKSLVRHILSEVNILKQSFSYGNVIRNGVPVVIAGSPNAGKSTLLNALLNEERAIVSEIAGTTRDTIEEVLQIDGIGYRIIDTAGIRGGTTGIEAVGIEKTYEKIRQAAIVIYLFDTANTSAAELMQGFKELGEFDAKVIGVGNKVDTLSEEAIREEFGAFPDLVFISSLLQQNLEELKQRLGETVRSLVVQGNDVVITNARHFEALNNTAHALSHVLSALDTQVSGELLAFDIRKALHHLGEITGEITNDELLANIFGKFCIGK
jgi:tRNA modification GTPase